MCLGKLHHIKCPLQRRFEDTCPSHWRIEDSCLEDRRLENIYHLLIPILSRVPHKASPILLGLQLLLYFISIFGTAQAHVILMENLEDDGIKSK